ncbi:hypothetical protein MTP99_008931 [Tenebrio molitor]|jgi:hypothetical protein|nr:hypothetical protein MTP99_008931 [Tenebrio molitor]
MILAIISCILFSAAYGDLDSMVTSGLAATSWTPDPECPYPRPGEVIYLPVPGDCTKWIECWDGTKYENQCSDGLWWHPAIENCDYPGDYCDGSRPDPRCIDHTTNYFPHPTSCNRYIECHEGNSYEMACAPGLYFSDSHKTCVNAALSDCCQTSTQC